MAYTYTGTPNQRIEQAKRRISTESVDVNSTLSAYQNRVAEIQKQEQAQAQQQEYESNASGIVRFGDTLGEFFKDVATGLEKAFEGIIDFGAGTVGTIAGWAGNNNLKQEMTNFVSRDLIEEQWDAARNAGLDVDFDDSYINDLSETGQGIVKGVAQGIGQMLPMVVATVATGGAAGAAATAGKISAGTANAIVKAGQVANMVGLGASAAGRGTEEALNTEIVDEYGNVTKPTLDRAYLYGLATGAVEMATEKLVGGIYSKAVGGGIADNLISKLAKSSKFSKAVKFGLDVMGEGVEEMVSASVEKTLQTIYNSTDGKMHWENPDIQDVFVSGVVGTLTSAVMGGGQVAVRKASSVATTQDAMLDIENTLKKANNLSKKGKLAEQAEALESEINKSAELIALRYQRASDKGKERLLAIQGVRELLAEDGSVRKTALNEGVAEISREKAVGAMSGSLALTRRNEVANVVASQNTTIAESLDTEQKSNFAKLEKMLELTGKEAGKQMKVVALEKHEANAFIKDDVMYISKDRLADKNATARDFAHEVFHFAEGTKEYRDVAKMFDRMTIDGKNLFDLATDEVKSLGYEVDAKVFEMLKEGKTAEEITNTGVSEHDVRLALSEIRAKQSEIMFGNAEVITKMAEADQSLAKKILKRIKESIKVIETVFKGDKETLETLKVLRQAEKLWQDALAVSGMKSAKAKGKITVEGVEADGSIANEYEQVIQESKASKELAEKLDKEGHETVYRAMQVIDGKLYPPMAAKIDGKLVEPTQLNVWYQADEHPELVDKNGKFKLDKANGSSISAAYNPYWHTSRSMLNDQFSSAYKRPNLVVVECEVPTSELTSNYKAEGAKDAVGEVNWHSGVVSSKLRGEKARKVILSRYVKVKRIVPNTEVAKNIAQLLEGTNISIPINVVTPSLREALLDEGVEISGVKGLKQESTSVAVDSQGRTLSQEQAEFFKDSKIVDKNGNLLVVYHGTPKGTFNEFRTDLGGAYFTTNKEYAQRYAKSHQSNDARLYEAYLNITKPFDTRNAKERKIFENEFYGQWGNGAPLTERGLPDWTDGDDLIDFFAEKGYDYDGLIIDEGGDFDENGKPVLRGESYVAISPNQIKSVDNKKPTESPDIRYSLRVGDENIAVDNEILSKKQTVALRDRGVVGDAFLNAEDLAKEILSVGGTITEDGKAVLYHGTTAEAAAKIKESGKMVGKEPNLYFSTKKDGLILDYGKSVVEVQIPLEKLELNDIFDDELHLTMATQPNRPTNVRFSLRESIEDDVLKKYGKTYRWVETGYLLKDGSRLDLSGRNEGARGGYRTVDHRDIFYDEDGTDGTDAMIEFMQRGNIRVMPEQAGINLQIEPTEAQYRQIQNLVETLGWKNKEFSVDFDNANGDTIDNLYYEGNVPARKVIADIRYYFKEGKTPYQSELSQFRYSLRENATDSNGRELTDRQVAYFQDSKVRDKDGNLLVMYHGTDAYKEIKVFKKGKRGYLGGGIYLTSDKAYAERYANKNGYKGTIYETYVNAENPLVVTSVDVAREILKAIYGTDTVWKKRTEKQASVTDLITNADINKLRAKGYDGILWDYANSIEISVFESNQIKRVDNEKPTYNDDVRYSKRYIYHAGKFNENGHKAETLYTSTPSRHTGFFGTGTYGVDSDHIHELSLGSYKGKPFSVIDISQYNLFDATNDDTAARLHRFLKDITRKAFESKNSEKVNILYNQFKALFPSDKVIAYDEFKSLIDELKQYVKDNEGYTKSKDLDSVSTRFMKHFGYEGVNTIGTYHADTEYGTVIYDLREDSIVVKESTDETQRKAFTDDIRYSKRSFGDTKTKVELLKSLQGMQLDYYGKYYAKIEDPASFFEEGSLGDRLANQILAMADEAEPNKYAFANDLATHIVNNLAVTTVDDYSLDAALDNANAIREYRHKLNLDGIKGDIQYRYGNKNSIFALWKAKKGTTGINIMDAVDELRYKGVIINAEVDADAFFEMLDMVEYANEQANKVLSGTAKDYLKADEYDALVEGLRDDIISFMENKGTKAEWENYYKTITRQADAYLERAKQKARDIEKLATLEAENALEKAKHAYDKDARKLQNEYETKIKELTNEMQQMALNDIEYNQRYNDLVSKVWSEANSLTMDNIKKYKNAGDLLNNEFAGVVKKLSGIKWRGELKKAGTRKIIAEFGKWYNTSNPLLTGGLDQAEIDKMMADDNVVSIGYLDKFALRGIEIMRENQTRESRAGKTKGQQIPNDKQLTYDELMICRAVLSSARHILQSYNTLQIAKQRVKLDETATKTNNLATTMSKITHLKHKTTDKILGLMMQALTPADVIGYQFGYQDNALSDLFQQIQDGETHARSLEIDLNDIVDNFFKEHKHYKKTLSSTIKFGEYEIRRDVALSLYMLTLQEDSREGLLLGGWGYTDDTGYWKEQGKMTEGEIRELSQALSNTDKDFVKTLRRFFNAAGEAMAETDMMLKGYSLVDGNANSHYFPIKRYSGDMAKSVADVDAIKNAMSVSVANFSFTHERVKNVRRIDVRPVLSVVKTHAKQVSLYNGLALPIKEFQRLYNFNVADDGSTNSLRNTINEKTWNGFHKYVTKLFEDIQSEKGIKAENGAVSRVLGKVRSNYAKFQLGANMKTWFAQLSGYPAALPYLSPQSMAKAFTKSLYWKSQNAQNLYKYCEWAKVKAHDGGVVLVETLSDKIGVVGDIATKPIQLMDNFLNRILWNAAQFEIERTKGFKFGTKENMELAGELHTLLGRKTQGNAATSELSAMQRHTSETVKMLAMFNSDGFKMLSRLFEGITRVRVQNHLAKTNPEMVTAKSQKEAKVFLAKTTTAILTSALIYTLVGELFKFLYDKERKDKEGNEIGFAEDFGMSYLSTVVGMIPIMRDIYSLVVEGYEVDNYALSGITEFITSFEGIAEGVTILASGEPFETKDLARPLKDLVNALGQLTGIPTRNVYNTIYGLTKRFDASAAYKWDSIFYAQGYTKDLKKAIEKDDVDLQKTIIGLMLKDNGLTDTSEKVNNKLRELYAEGYTVLPKTVQDTLHYDGETYNLSNKQVKQFKTVYGKANEEVEALVNDRHFKSLAAEVQAQAIKWIYDYYYESAVFDTIGEEDDSKKQLFGETMDVSKFALTIAACKSIESKLDKKGNVIAGSRKVQIQRLLASLNLSPAEKQLILAYLGYSVADQETLIKAFVRRIGLTKSQQKLLLSYCGIAV